MTVKERIIDGLVQNGMFEEQAIQVFELAKPKIDALAKDYKISYDSPSDQYPAMMYSLWFITIKPVALTWIDNNIPLAWYREIFV